MDLVPFEIAKKLKEKGFKEKCLAYYDIEDNVGLLYNTQYTNKILPCQYIDLLQSHNSGEAEIQPDDSEECVDAPTISQVLKWLREEKKIDVLPQRGHISIDKNSKVTRYYNVNIYFERSFACTLDNDEQDYSTYEQAAFAGIKHILDNLI